MESSKLVIAGSKVVAIGFLGIAYHYVIDDESDLDSTKKNIDIFLRHARNNPASNFKIVRFGNKDDIAPMFTEAPPNCILPSAWKDILGDNHRWWNS